MATFEVDVPIRWVDLDAQGHVNNAVVVDYLQEARVGALLPGPNGRLLGRGLVVVGHQVEYLAPIEFSHEPLRVSLRLGDVRAASYRYAYELRQGATPVARARTQICLFDFEAQRPRRISDAERVWFDEVAEPLDDLPRLDSYRVGASAHEHAFAVRWSDLDSYGHVNNVRFLTYVGEARVALNRGLITDALAVGSASMLMIVRQDMRYVAQLEHRLEPYLVRTAFAKVGRSSITFAHEIVDPLADGAVIARSTAVLVHADASGRPTPVPDAVRDAATRWAVD